MFYTDGMCIIMLIAAFFPRLALVLLWLFGGGYLERAVQPGYWLLLGFLFLPLTTLAFAFGMNSLGMPGQVPPFGWLLTIIALAADLGILGGGSRSRWHRRNARFGQ